MKVYLLYIVFSFFGGSLVGKTGVLHQPLTFNRQSTAGFTRQAFYKAMEENIRLLVDSQLIQLKTAPEDIRPAFTGAMLMKKAGLGGSPAIKLELFKKGQNLLEAAIKKDPGNAEFRFLRLIIQEHAPGVLGYKSDLDNDSAYIKKSYKSLSDELQQTIANYSKKSKVLKLQVS